MTTSEFMAFSVARAFALGKRVFRVLTLTRCEIRRVPISSLAPFTGRRIRAASGSLQFHMWFPGCPMEPDAYNIPKPKGTPVFRPEMLRPMGLPDGVRVIEFNARFGDPETQVVLRRLTNPLESLLHRAATGRLADGPSAQFSDDVAITVVLASEGYPDSAAPDREISGLREDANVEHCHAATKLIDGKLMATGGRVLSVVASAKDFATARELAYENIKQIHLQGAHYRRDIAKKVAN